MTVESLLEKYHFRAVKKLSDLSFLLAGVKNHRPAMPSPSSSLRLRPDNEFAKP
jgi:hypothetical protein